MKEIIRKEYSRTKINSQNHAQKQKSYQRNEDLGIPSCKTLGTILKIDEGNSKRSIKLQWKSWPYTRLYTREMTLPIAVEREFANIQNCVGESIQRIKDNVKKSDRRLITAASNTNNNWRITKESQELKKNKIGRKKKKTIWILLATNGWDCTWENGNLFTNRKIWGEINYLLAAQNNDYRTNYMTTKTDKQFHAELG